MEFDEYVADTYRITISAEVQIPAAEPETKYGVEQYTCISTTCPDQLCPECGA